MQNQFSPALGPDFNTELLPGVLLCHHSEYVDSLNLAANLTLSKNYKLDICNYCTCPKHL